MIMDNQGNNTHTFIINNTTFSTENSLTHLLDTDEPEDEIANIKLSKYTDINTLSESLRSAKSSLSILSLNSQSLNAKFDDFQIAIEQLNRNNQISVICIQETWLSSESPTSLFDLPNYQLILRSKYCSNHGGLITYMHNDFNWEPVSIKDQTTGWENLFIKISHNKKNSKKYIIGNIYRLPSETVNDLQTFNDEFLETLEILQSKRLQVYLCGDYNINLLNVYKKDQYNIFFENLVSAGYLPKISLPTRITDHSATLIDNIFGNRIDNNESGIIINNISDHQMIYTYSTEQFPCHTRENQYVQLETKDAQAMNKFINKLQDLNIADKLNKDVNADPNDNLKQFIDIFTNLKNKYLPKKKVKLNKRKHKVQPWMTKAILNSINSRDKIYKTLMLTSKESPNYSEIHRNFKTYKNIIRRSIMLAKRDYYIKTFSKYSKNLRMTWNAINETLNRHKSKRRFPAEFKLANGKIISDHKVIADAFNDYFIGIGAQDTETPQGNSHYSDYLSNKPNCNLQFHPITNCDVAEIIGNLKPKTSTGIDNVSSKLLRQTKDSITESLTIIVNQMLKTGTFPVEMGRNRYRVLEVSGIGSILKYRYRQKIRYRYRVLFDTISILFRYFTSTDNLTLSCNEKKYKDY